MTRSVISRNEALAFVVLAVVSLSYLNTVTPWSAPDTKTPASRQLPMMIPLLSSDITTRSRARRYPSSRRFVASTDTDTSSSSSSMEETSSDDDDDDPNNMPELGKEGVYHLENQDQFRALMNANTDKLVVLKVFAPWCKACKGLEPKFNGLVRDQKYKDLPIIWASLTIQNNKEFVKSIGVLALPTIQFYARGQKMETFACGPSKVPILKRKLAQFVNENVDPKTYELKDLSGSSAAATTKVPASTAAATPSQQQQQQYQKPPEQETSQSVVERERSLLRSVKYLSDLLESEFESLLSKATLLTFEAGSIIMREGNMGHRFYIILDGEVEICQRTSFEDPLTTPPSYLGTVINRQDEKGEYFGERSLITGEPRAASIRASQRTTCLVFEKDDFPQTSVLSGRYVPDETLDEVNDKYGKTMIDVELLTEAKQYQDSVTASQIRGSVNTPDEIDGVDNEKEMTDELIQQQLEKSLQRQRDESPTTTTDTTSLPDTSTEDSSSSSSGFIPSLGVSTETIIPLLVRFKLVRDITRCLDYMVENRLSFGDAGSRRRRAMLINVLGPLQRQEITDAFKLIDEDGNDQITLMELKRLLNSIGEERSDQELLGVIESSRFDSMDDKKIMTAEDFTGLMAEAEIYYLFLDTFKAMDPSDTGFVRAKDLDQVLCGVRDLISDDRRSIIDVDDTEMMVDYEQFSRMLLGSALNP